MLTFTLAAFADEADATIAGQVKALRAAGIRRLEIRGVDGTNISRLSIESAKRVKRQLDDAGISVWAIGSPSGKMDIRDPFGPHLEEFRHMLALAELFGAKRFRLFSFFGTQGAIEWEEEVLRRMNGFIEAARGSGVVLCHENEKGIYGDSAARCLRLHQALPALRAVFDFSNFIQVGQETSSAWAMLKEYVEYIHAKDAMPDGSVVPAGFGVGNIAEILADFAAMSAAKNTGGPVISLEPHLTVFDGLKDLEQDGDISHVGAFVYPDQPAAFAAAAAALKDVLKKIGGNAA
ncbi:MAG: sugar phosphate isomerase/epimerase [Oscillospiraceae bacterium]|nr:sugar phosphate isomerase/epimerase [Oscillospiraceae bacterium]